MKQKICLLASALIFTSAANANWFGFGDMGGDLAPSATSQGSNSWFGDIGEGIDDGSWGAFGLGGGEATPQAAPGIRGNIKSSYDAFQRLAGSQGIYHGGTPQRSSVSLVEPTTRPPGGGITVIGFGSGEDGDGVGSGDDFSGDNDSSNNSDSAGAGGIGSI